MPSLFYFFILLVENPAISILFFKAIQYKDSFLAALKYL